MALMVRDILKLNYGKWFKCSNCGGDAWWKHDYCGYCGERFTNTDKVRTAYIDIPGGKRKKVRLDC